MSLQSLIKQRREIWAALIHLYQEQSLKLQPIWFAHPNRTISPSWNKMRGRQKEGKGKRKIRDIWILKCWRRMRLPFCSSSLAAARVGASSRPPALPVPLGSRAETTLSWRFARRQLLAVWRHGGAGEGVGSLRRRGFSLSQLRLARELSPHRDVGVAPLCFTL